MMSNDNPVTIARRFVAVVHGQRIDSLPAMGGADFDSAVEVATGR